LQNSTDNHYNAIMLNFLACFGRHRKKHPTTVLYNHTERSLFSTQF